ncbi:twisted gastrulation protein homolog 1-A [Exaiptasia diaphana]|uniref:Protein twisted gastrulation n=1 Tax=Exaiptasia diaphana TaxID=2652724 RepID=A0A913Y6G8_EXADI|nr:twisted gastrulation protein homolog 1-A [Exaiptasia diaphana]KXJ22116.1 Twisted gastrulation protein-like 1-A [Exaiptasia diaphana]
MMFFRYFAAVLLCYHGINCGPTNNATTSPRIPVFRPCNEQVCASRLSACQLMQACNCVPPDCSCCADCTNCLGSLWNSCCDCLGLCLAHLESSSPLNYVIGDLSSSIPSLFNALSEGQNDLPAVFTFRPHASFTPTQPSQVAGNRTRSGNSQQICKTAFFDNCRSLKHCKTVCNSMGAQRYRWFHNGCCQCVGHYCVDYGETKPLCKNCKN